MSQLDPDRPAIVAEGLAKLYRRTAAGHQLRTLKSALLERSLVKGLRPEDSIPALTDISFAVQPGEAVGLIGSNGSGKSTLLKIAAGILQPTAGQLTVHGRVAALIELGAGFHPEISGRENIYINGAVLGLTRRQIDERYSAIVEFSGLADFIEEPVKHYSSGMYVRLGFAVAIHTDPDVLIVDEVLSVGDEAFAHKCLRRIEELLASGKTLLLVSHSLGLIEDVCDRALWIEKGHLRLDGHPRRVADAYREAVAEAEAEAHREAAVSRAAEAGAEVEEAPDEPRGPVLRWGSGVVEIERLRLCVDDDETFHVHCGDKVRFEIDLNVHRAQDDFAFGLGISTPRGVECWGINTTLAGLSPATLSAGQTTVSVLCPNLRLAPGEYWVDVAVHAVDGTPYDYRRQLLTFTVTAIERGVGLYFPEHSWSFGDRVTWCDTESKPDAIDNEPQLDD